MTTIQWRIPFTTEGYKHSATTEIIAQGKKDLFCEKEVQIKLDTLQKHGTKSMCCIIPIVPNITFYWLSQSKTFHTLTILTRRRTTTAYP